MSAHWCIGLKPTSCEGRYLLTTMHQQLSKACKWLDDNLKELFSEYIPQFQTFTPIEGYKYPKRGDKPRFSNQLSTYANQLCTLHPSTNPQESSQTNQWNKSPLHTKTWPFVFDTDEYPALQQQKAKRTQTGETKYLEHVTKAQKALQPSTANPNVTNYL